MNPTSMFFVSNAHLGLVGMERRSDHHTPAIDIRFKITNTSLLFFSPYTIFQTVPVLFTRKFTVRMRDFVNQDRAYHHCSRMLSLINVVHPGVILETAPGIACMLGLWSRHAILGGLNSIEVEILLDNELWHLFGAAAESYWAPSVWTPSAAAQGQGMSTPNTIGFDGGYDDFDELEEDAELNWATTYAVHDFDELEEDAELSWATTESVNSLQPVSCGLFESSSPEEVEAFLQSCHAQTWNSNAQCIICLECLGGEEKEIEENEEEVISLAGCSHLFHGECIRKWFEVSDACPLCRRTFSTCLRSIENP